MKIKEMGFDQRMGLFLAVILMGLSAQARVFKLANENFATYLRGQYGMAQQKDSPFAPSSGAAETFSDEYKTNLSYEFGFVYATEIINMRFGFEVIKPADLKEVSGKRSGVEQYSLTSNISGYVPKIGIEVNVKQWERTRLFLNVNYGAATVTVQNSYTFTTAGNSSYTGMTDFREELKGTASLMEGSAGVETWLSDTTTLVIDAGYRTLEVDSLTHQKDVTTFQGVVTSGTTAKNTNGSNRSLSLSGGYGALTLRIWIK